MLLLFFILNIILSLVIIIYSVLFTIYFITTVVSDAPFVPVNKGALDAIVLALNLTPKSILYDLGCGDGRVLQEALKTHLGVQAIGYEKNLVPYIIARLNTRGTHAEIHMKNFVHADLKNATHIYMYLFPKIVNVLFLKCKKECLPGTRIITCDYTPSGIIPDEIIDLPPSKNKLCKKLYVYILK